jgi:CelD/BcsL family acetyltransferase involved in cellulose biosynthesis
MWDFALVERFEDLDPLQDEWDALAARSDFVDVFATFGFARAWWHAYGEGKLLRTVTARDRRGALRLVAPMWADWSAPVRWRFLGNVRADYNNVVFDSDEPEVLPALIWWMRRRKDWQQLVFSKVPASSATARILPASLARDAGLPARVRAWLDLRAPLSYLRFKRDHPHLRGEALRRGAAVLDEPNYREKIRRLSRAGSVAYRCIHGPDGIAEWLETFFELHVRAGEHKGQPSLFLQSVNREFYRLLLKNLEPRALRLDLLTLDGSRLLAAHFGFEWAGRVYYYKPCFEPEFSRESPGRVLVPHVLRQACQAGMEEVDFLQGLEEYKLRFEPALRETAWIEVYRSRAAKLRAGAA